MLVSMDEIPHSNEQGIEHWNVRKFLGEFKLQKKGQPIGQPCIIDHSKI